MRDLPDLLWGCAWQALHTRRGIHFATWEKRMGISFADTRAAYAMIDRKIQYLEDQGWVEEDTASIRVRNWDCMTTMTWLFPRRDFPHGSTQSAHNHR
jgi:coproporphyrinogen III oxidase-like Fe-S oxidoreductase